MKMLTSSVLMNLIGSKNLSLHGICFDMHENISDIDLF